MWPRHKGIMVGPEEYFESQMQALLAPGSPYLKSDPYRLRQLRAHMPTIEKICLIGSMRSLFDRPLMILALLQTCVETSKFCRFWLPIPGHIEGIVKTPSSLTFRKTWLEHAMQVSGAVKKSGKSCQRTWAKLLVASNEPDLINEKAIEVNRWLKGTKLPSLKNVKRAGEIIFNRTDASRRSKEIAADLWLFSWMIALWLEKHFTEISKEFKGDRQKIQSYYRGFYGYL